jgi:putative ABC transport system permease protein
MIARIGPVTSVTATGGLIDTRVYRNDLIPAGLHGGIAVLAARTDLLGTVGRDGGQRRVPERGDRPPSSGRAGAAAAPRLGISAARPEEHVWLGGRWFTVVGILHPVTLAPELDNDALVGWPAATERLGFDGYATTVYTHSQEESVEAVRAVLAQSANPENPNEVQVSRPPTRWRSKRATDRMLNALLLGLGAVALLVGGVGVANTMVISIPERRAEIGLRRSIGATRGQIRLQFLAESLLLSALGGVGGVVLGIGVTGAYAVAQSLPAIAPRGRAPVAWPRH